MGEVVLTWLVWALIVSPPIARILRRLGFNPWLATLWCIPLIGPIALWCLAYVEWPGVPAPREGGKEWSEADWKLFKELERQRQK
jgi:hypothetical protein